MSKLVITKPSKKIVLITVLSFATLATIVTVASKAATPTANFDLGTNSSITAPATGVTDATAFGGSAIQFKSASVTPPTGTSRCPAYPSFPDANCTGVIAGTTLSNCNSNVTQSNAVYDKCLFSNGLGIAATAKNVKITNSKVIGTVYCATSNCYNMNLQMTDFEIDGRNDNADGLGGLFGYTCLRCNVHDASKGFAGGNFRIEDSYVHDIYGVHSCTQFPGDCQSHNEAILPFNGDDNTLLHNNLNANYSAASSGGGMSAAIALYTHSDFWGGIDNVLIEKNRIANTASPYCAYLGNTTDPDGNPSNLRLIDNVFVSCNTFLGWLRGNGNVWTNNRFTSTTGSLITEPDSGNYQ